MIWLSESKWASKIASTDTSSNVSNHVSLQESVLSPLDSYGSMDTGDLALVAVKTASQLTCPHFLSEFDIFQAVMEDISTLLITSVCYIPRKVRSLLSKVLASEFRDAVSCDI